MMRSESVHQSAAAHGNIPAVSTASPQRCPSPILCRRLCAIIQPGNSLAALELHPFVASFRRRLEFHGVVGVVATMDYHGLQLSPRWAHRYRLEPGPPLAPPGM